MIVIPLTRTQANDLLAVLECRATDAAAHGVPTPRLDAIIDVVESCIQASRLSHRPDIRVAEKRAADHIDGYDRDDLGESPDF